MPAVFRHGLTAGSSAAYDLGALPRFLRRARWLSLAEAERFISARGSTDHPAHVQLAATRLSQLVSLRLLRAAR
jgi:hypothetical protein